MISTYSVPRVEYVETDYYIVLPALEQNYGGAFAVRGQCTFHQYIIEFINTTKEDKMKEVPLSVCTTALFAVPVVDAVAVDGSGKLTYKGQLKVNLCTVKRT